MPWAKTAPCGVHGGTASPTRYRSPRGGRMTIETRAALLLTALLLGSSVSTSSASAFGLVGNISAGLGEKWGSGPSFSNLAHKGGTREPSVNVMLGHRALPILLEGYASGTRRDGSPATMETLLQETRIEFGLGVAGIRRVGPFYSHFGGGIARVSSRMKQLYSLEPKDSNFTRTGHWIGAGAFCPLVAGFGVGAIGRYTNVRHKILGGGNPDQVGGWSASALIGWGSLSSR